MVIRAWFAVSVALAVSVGCSSRTTGGGADDSSYGGGTGGTSIDTARGGSTPTGGPAAVGGMLIGGAGVGGMLIGGAGIGGSGGADVGSLPSGGNPNADHFTVCKVVATIPILSLPDGTLATCVDEGCIDQKVAAGKVAQGRVVLVDAKLEATWTSTELGSNTYGCLGFRANSVTFKSPRGSVVTLFSGKIPTTATQQTGLTQVVGSVTVQPPIDIAALVLAEEAGGAGGQGQGGQGGQAEGGSGGAP